MRKPLEIIMHGVTGRMGMNQHLIRSILAIREEGGVLLSDGTRQQVEPFIVGRNAEKMEALAKKHNIKKWTTDMDEALASDAPIFFDAGMTSMRPGFLEKAIAAGKHVYCEKPSAESADEALRVYDLATKAGVKNGIVQDKLWLPGLMKLQKLIDADFFGKILSVKIDFGYWVFEGDIQPAQRPSWNYRKEDGGGIIIDMMCHWHYVIKNLFGTPKALTCLGPTLIKKRWDEKGAEYNATADDACYATVELENDVIVNVVSSWCTRVRRDDLVTFHVDGTHGSAVAGLTDCYTQHRVNTPKPVWNPDVKQPLDFYETWEKMPENESYNNAFREQWEMFIRHVVEDTPWDYSLLAGAKGVAFADASLKSDEERRWIDLTDIEKMGGLHEPKSHAA